MHAPSQVDSSRLKIHLQNVSGIFVALQVWYGDQGELEAHREVAGADDLDSEHSLVLKGDDTLGGSAHQLLPRGCRLLRALVLLLCILARRLEGAVLHVTLQRRHNLRRERPL